MQKNEKNVKYKSIDGITLSGTFMKKQNQSKSCIVMCHGLKTDREDGVIGASFGASILSLINYAYFPQVKKLIIYSGSIDNDKGNPKGSLGIENYEKALIDGSVNIQSKTTGKIMTLSETFMRETRELIPEEKIKKITIPILFLHGTEDKTTPYEVNKTIAQQCKNSYFATIEGASHGLHKQNDRRIAIQYILRFLQIEKIKGNAKVDKRLKII